MTPTPAEILARQEAKLRQKLAELEKKKKKLTSDPAVVIKTAAADPINGPAVAQAVYTAVGNSGPLAASILGMSVSAMHTLRKTQPEEPVPSN